MEQKEIFKMTAEADVKHLLAKLNGGCPVFCV
jgi:hypothetical protein